MSISHTSSKFTITFVADELFAKICNTSAVNAKYVAPEVNTDSLILSDDERYFFDSNIDNILSSLAAYFVRVMGKDDTFGIIEGKITLSFTSGKQSSAGEENILSTLTEQYIIVEVLRLWYTSVAINEVLATKYVDESVSVDRRLRIALFPFYRPSHSTSIFDYIKVVGAPGADKIHHINNRSDFILLWKAKSGEELPQKFSIIFYTTGAEIYEVAYGATAPEGEFPKVVPIEDTDGKYRSAHIVFDLSATGNYFGDGALSYTMVSHLENAMFPDNEQVVESTATLPIEIWGGTTDFVAQIEAAYIPAFMKLRLSDLTADEIKILQTPALEAAKEANAAAEEALKQGGYANQQANIAKQEALTAKANGEKAVITASNAATKAYQQGEDTEKKGNYAKEVAQNILDPDGEFQQAEATRKANEAARQQAEEKRQTDTTKAIEDTKAATQKAENVVDTLEEFKNETTERVDELEVKIDRVFDGGRADSVYGPAARVVNCGKAII
ncbi:MAG: hypothetical protein IJF01_07225 [Tidjanibacter sp.]|nr:hypothetical protein [Tidjanibacter sp.]